MPCTNIQQSTQKLQYYDWPTKKTSSLPKNKVQTFQRVQPTSPVIFFHIYFTSTLTIKLTRINYYLKQLQIHFKKQLLYNYWMPHILLYVFFFFCSNISLHHCMSNRSIGSLLGNDYHTTPNTKSPIIYHHNPLLSPAPPHSTLVASIPYSASRGSSLLGINWPFVWFSIFHI